MHTFSKVIPFPIPLKPGGKFSPVAFPRFAVAFGDRDAAPIAIIVQPKLAVTGFDAPGISPCH